MSERFFVPSIADATRIEGVEAHHLSHVLRARAGERVTLFDGSGREALAEILEIGRSDVSTRTLETREVDRELPLRIEIAMSLPKGDRAGFLVEKLTELGVARLIPIVSERSVSSASGSSRAEKPEKLLRRSIEACKQCGRNRLLEIGEPTRFSDYVSECVDVEDRVRWIADADATAAHYVVAEKLVADRNEGPSPKVVSILIGPEGGFAQEEVVAAVAAGWHPIGIGRTILRMETAAIALAAIVAATDRR